MEFTDLLKLMVAKEASDLYLTVGAPPSMRIQGQIKPIDNNPIPVGLTQVIAKKLMNADQQAAFDKNPGLQNLLLDEFFSSALNKYGWSWRKAIIHAIEIGVPTPAFSTALSFYDGYRTERLPANLLQAQRDFFGAHTYERVDKPRGEFFHTNWTGHGGVVSSSTYTV